MGESDYPEDAIKEISMADVAKFTDDPKRIFYVGMFFRPGVRLFGVMLEYGFYHPATPKNDYFQILIVHWEQIPWVVYSIPKDEFANAEAVCKLTGLRIANGVPTLLGNGKAVQFPLNTNSVFTLENISGSLIYDPDFKEEKLIRLETELTDNITSGQVDPLTVNFIEAIKKANQ